MNCLDVTVSGYNNTKDNAGVDTPLLTWLTNPRFIDKIRPYIDYLRGLSDPGERAEFKREYLPAITPGGRFSQRGEKYLIEPSGLIQFDIDFKDNTHIRNYGSLKTQLSKIKNIAYLGLSASGNGYWGLIPISEPENLKDHFAALYARFLKMGIVLDPAPTNVASMRFFSYDNEYYINPVAEVFTQKGNDQPDVKTQANATNQDWQFNNQNDIYSVLVAYGWTKVKEDSRRIYMNRPGAKNSRGVDGDVLKETNSFWCFSSSAGLEVDTRLTPSDVRKFYENR